MQSSTAEFLGQAGFRFRIGEQTIYVDPYLSDSVEELDAPDLRRQVVRPLAPEKVDDADWVLITHEHIDHCDPHTLPQLAKASPDARFLGPSPVLERLKAWGIAPSRLDLAKEAWFDLGGGVRVYTVPAAHPQIERDSEGNLACVGFVLELLEGERIYIAGDTSLEDAVLQPVKQHGPYEIAFLPVNEPNYFRERRGIIGNMTVREAFGFAEEISAERMYPCHWDMFAANSVYPEEIRVVYERLKPKFRLVTGESVSLTRSPRLASIVIRTLNEAKHLEDLLLMIQQQKTDGLDWEVVLIDSGSTDGTVDIAERYGCRITYITRDEFSFGRSLNRGSEFSDGDILVFISGHCVPADSDWLQNLCQPIIDGTVSYSYGRQVGDDDSYFSERRIFAKYYPSESRVPQEGFYCNNANSALSREAWEKLRFDEDLTGLEDMELARRLVEEGQRIGYVAEAPVYHHHDESWPNVRKRFQREAIALQKIMPEVHLSALDVARYIVRSIWLDWFSALRNGHLGAEFVSILRYRWNQYVGSYKGNHEHRQLSQNQKDRFFYPATEDKDGKDAWLHSYRRASPNEGKQRAREREEF